MESFASKRPLLLSLILFFYVHLLPFGSATDSPTHITYHNGPLLTGDLNLSILWYGNIPDATKYVIQTFIRSLNRANGESFEPQVLKWWDEVERYQAEAKKNLENVPSINLKLASEVIDDKYSLGKELNADSVPGLLQKATAGKLKAVAVVFISEDVTLEDSCKQRCFQHGAIGEQVYILIKNPMEHCPGRCAWPFHTLDLANIDILMKPPNENSTDVMIAHFASALASTVTNPYGNGFYSGSTDKSTQTEIGDVCTKEFGSDAFPGYPGRYHVDPSNGKAFNAHGLNHTKFLLPGLWKPTNGKCWTLM